MHLRFFFIGISIVFALSAMAVTPAFAQETSENDLKDTFEPTPGPNEQPQEASPPQTKDDQSLDVPPPSTFDPGSVKSDETETSPPPQDDDGGQSIKPSDSDQGVVENKSHKICDCRFDSSVPYRERRPAITGIFGMEAGQYQPVNYVPQVGSEANQVGVFPSYYGGTASPNVELIFGAKYNFLLGSIGPQIGGGFFTASNSTDGASLTVYPITAGLTYQMDTIFSEPYVVPYVTGGAYMDFYNESAGGITVSGNTGVGMFYSLGLLFQLDWIDTEAHDSAYTDFGIENTFLFIEARSFLPTQDAVDFSTPLQFSGGLKFEF